MTNPRQTVCKRCVHAPRARSWSPDAWCASAAACWALAARSSACLTWTCLAAPCSEKSGRVADVADDVHSRSVLTHAAAAGAAAPRLAARRQHAQQQRLAALRPRACRDAARPRLLPCLAAHAGRRHPRRCGEVHGGGAHAARGAAWRIVMRVLSPQARVDMKSAVLQQRAESAKQHLNTQQCAVQRAPHAA